MRTRWLALAAVILVGCDDVQDSGRTDTSVDSGSLDTSETDETDLDAPPSAKPDDVTTTEDAPVTIDVLENDTDDAGPLSVSGFDDSGTTGTVVLNEDGTITWSPGGAFEHLRDDTAEDTFDYTVTDGVHSVVATVTVTVTGVNDGPSAANDAYTVAEGDALVVPSATGVLVGDSDPDRRSLSVQVATGPSHGLLSLEAGGAFVYVHDGSETTADSFTYTLTDGELTDTGTVALTVTPRNDPPMVDLDGTLDDPSGDRDIEVAFTEYGGPVALVANANLLVSDADGSTLEGATLTVSGGTGAEVLAATVGGTGISATFTNQVLTLSGTFGHAEYQSVLRSVTFDLPGGVTNHSDRTVTVRLDDGDGPGPASTATVHITDANGAPVAVADAFTTNEDTAIDIAVLDNDSDPDADLLAVESWDDTSTIGTVNQGPGTKLSWSPDGQFEALDAGEQASDAFTYTLTDGASQSSTTVTITVNGVNDAPVITVAADREDASLDDVSFTAATATDAEEHDLVFSATGLPPGVDIDSATGVLSGTLAQDAFEGSPHTVQITVTDEGSLTDDGTFTWTVTGQTCFDGIQNQGESAVDCGGPCGLCPVDNCADEPDFTPCTVATTPDRAYDICIAGTCQSPGCGTTDCNDPGVWFPMPDTQQTACYDNSSPMTCPEALEGSPCAADGSPAFCGQDAQYGADLHGGSRFERLAPKSSKPLEQVVVDDTTGMTWMGCIHGKYGDACAQDAQGTVIGITADVGRLDWDGAVAACDALEYAGFPDWRLPTMWELASIQDLDASNPALDATWFPGVTGGMTSGREMWASGSYSETQATFVDHLRGNGGWRSKTDVLPFRCVRGQPRPTPERFTDPSGGVLGDTDAVVVDQVSSLMWTRCAHGQALEDGACTGTFEPHTDWAGALSACEALEFDGHDDWRLPNLLEHLSVMSLNEPDADVFPGGFNNHQYSSSTSKADNSQPWIVRWHGFGTGTWADGGKNSSLPHRCVHDPVDPED